MALSLCEGNIKLPLYLITYQAMQALGEGSKTVGIFYFGTIRL